MPERRWARCPPDSASDYFRFQQDLTQFADVLRRRMPSVQAVYVSRRSYGGFAESPGRGEPLSYEEGHALNQWLAAGGVSGDMWFGWGPYLWAPNCASGRTNGSGVCYDRTDYQADGVHPAAGALEKMPRVLQTANLLGLRDEAIVEGEAGEKTGE
jgi:hypothetical protein